MAASDGLTLQLAGVVINGATIAVGPSQVALDPRMVAGRSCVVMASTASRRRPGRPKTSDRTAHGIIHD